MSASIPLTSFISFKIKYKDIFVAQNCFSIIMHYIFGTFALTAWEIVLMDTKFREKSEQKSWISNGDIIILI